ncbi:MAG: hypothetical protein ACJAU2_001563, partial [Maribacter sp.]
SRRTLYIVKSIKLSTEQKNHSISKKENLGRLQYKTRKLFVHYTVFHRLINKLTNTILRHAKTLRPFVPPSS